MKPLIPEQLQALGVLVLLVFLLRVAWLVRGQKLDLRGSVMWLFSTLAALALALAPGILASASRALAIELPSNAFFALAIVYLAVNVLSNTIAASANAGRVRRLAQVCALWRAQLDELRAGPAR
jgi:hypothetical protein